jgi:hypothetical protein
MDLNNYSLIHLIEISTYAINPSNRFQAWTAIQDKSLIPTSDLVKIGRSGDHESLTREVHAELKKRTNLTIDDEIKFIRCNKVVDVVSDIYQAIVHRLDNNTRAENLVKIIINRSYYDSFGITMAIVNQTYALFLQDYSSDQNYLDKIAFGRLPGNGSAPKVITEDAEERLLLIPDLSSSILVSFCINSTSSERRLKAWYLFAACSSISYNKLVNIYTDAYDESVQQLAEDLLNSDYYNNMMSFMGVEINSI